MQSPLVLVNQTFNVKKSAVQENIIFLHIHIILGTEGKKVHGSYY